MGKQEVLKILERAKKPLTSTELARQLEIGARSVRRILSNLLEHSKRVKSKKLSQKEKLEKYGKPVNCPKIRVYFLKK